MRNIQVPVTIKNKHAGHISPPVGDPLKQKVALLREGFQVRNSEGEYQAWNVTNGTLRSEADRSIFERFKSPRETFDDHEKWYDPESEVVTQKLCDKLHKFTITPNSNPIEAPHALEDTKTQMAEKGTRISDTFLHAHFVCALLDEYANIQATLQVKKNHDKAEIICMVDTRYSTLL